VNVWCKYKYTTRYKLQNIIIIIIIIIVIITTTTLTTKLGQQMTCFVFTIVSV
jgi:hypothetical protein